MSSAYHQVLNHSNSNNNHKNKTKDKDKNKDREKDMTFVNNFAHNSNLITKNIINRNKISVLEVVDAKKNVQPYEDRPKYCEQTNITNGKRVNQNNKKKDQSKLIENNYMKRPQTPDPMSNKEMGYQSIRYPQPQVILKQIQRNVNVLKQMYFASLSQHHNSQSNRLQQEQIPAFIQSYHSHLPQRHRIMQGGNSKNVNHNYTDIRKSFDLASVNNKQTADLTQEYNRNQNFQSNKLRLDQFIQKQKTQQKTQQHQMAYPNKIINQIKNKKKQKQKQKQKNKGESNQKLQKGKLRSENRKSATNLQKSFKNKLQFDKQKSKHRPSVAQLHKSPEDYNELTKQKQNQKQKQLNYSLNAKKNDKNINGLFQIFKFYKKSIDSNMGKQNNSSQKSNNQCQSQVSTKTANNSINTNYSHMHTNAAVYVTRNQTYLNNDNQISQCKNTPNNSTAKNTTNHKNSTNSGICEISIDPLNQASIDGSETKNNPVEQKKSRNSSAENSNKKSKNRNHSNQSYDDHKSKGKNVKKFNKNQNYKQLTKNYYNQIQQNKNKKSVVKKEYQNQISLERNRQKKGSKQRQDKNILYQGQFQGFKKKSNSLAQKQSKNKGSYANCNQYNLKKIVQQTKENEKHENLQKIQYIQNLQFPEIQSSLFHKNMPILQQDSREEASSQLIALTNNKDNSLKKNIFSFNRVQDQNFQNQFYPKVEQLKFNQIDGFEEQKQNIVRNSQNIISFGVLKSYKQGSKRIPTPEFVNTVEISRGKNLEKHKQEDSLQGCQIQKRESDSDLQNFELVSFQL